MLGALRLDVATYEEVEAAYAWLAYLVGTKLIPARQTRSSLLLFVAVPGLTGLVRSGVSLWVLVLFVLSLFS